MTTQTSQTLRRPATRTRSAALIALAAALFVQPALAQDKFLAEKRWQEQAHGLSLLPPRDAKRADVTGDDAVVRFDGPSQYTIKIYVKKSNLDLSVPAIKGRPDAPPIAKVAHVAVGQIAAKFPQAVILQQRTLKLAGKPAALLFFKIPDLRRGPWVLGQAYVELDPKTFALVQLESAYTRYKFVRPVFDAMLASIRVQAAEELAHQRQEMIKRAIVWRKSLNTAELHSAIVPEQLLRIVEGNQTIGWMRITQMKANGWEQPAWRAKKEEERAAQRGKKPKRIVVPGVLVDVQSRMNVGPRAFDSNSRLFVADDGGEEIWTTRTTVRPLVAVQPGVGAGAGQPVEADRAQVSWAETGVREGNLIHVTQESPSSVQKFKWERPSEEQGNLYLSQAELYLVGGMLPRNVPMEVGFYAYYGKTGKVTFRTERVTPGPGGTITVSSRPTPDEAEQVTTYDRHGRITKRQLPNGWHVVPTTRQELKRLFAGLRLGAP